ncbi:MAG: hypothetical protein KDC27_13465 [Acidobacteria bacterium]|nr:hypothetical protein [Acidobacteriota bacterium]
MAKLLGITVLPEYIQSEGVGGVLDNLQRMGANAVATSPYLMEEADKQTGQREPPADAGAGAVRLLDRPLFGKREVWVRTAPSFTPDKALYKGLRYQPSEPTELTRKEGHILHDFIAEAHKRGVKVYFQVQAAIPPGYRVQFGGPVEADRARLPNGQIPEKRLDKNGSLAAPEILDYEHALIRDMVRQYPDLDGLRFDWPEYPPYFLDSMFLDFSDHARRAAHRMGYDFEAMQRDVGGLYDKLHGGLTDADLRPWVEDGDQGRYHLLRLMSDNPGVGDWLRFKAELVEEMLAGFRRVMNEEGTSAMEMLPNAFPPPWTIPSGMDFRRVARFSSAISCKLYTMHWPMMLRFYGDQIAAANPGLDNRLLTKFLVRALDIADDTGFDRLEDYSYPDPDTPHPVGDEAMARKIRQAQADAGETPVYVLAHGYGPLADFRRRLEVAKRAGKYGYWVNRYAYLHDDKLEAIREVGV